MFMSLFVRSISIFSVRGISCVVTVVCLNTSFYTIPIFYSHAASILSISNLCDETHLPQMAIFLRKHIFCAYKFAYFVDYARHSKFLFSPLFLSHANGFFFVLPTVFYFPFCYSSSKKAQQTKMNLFIWCS